MCAPNLRADTWVRYKKIVVCLQIGISPHGGQTRAGTGTAAVTPRRWFKRRRHPQRGVLVTESGMYG